MNNAPLRTILALLLLVFAGCELADPEEALPNEPTASDESAVVLGGVDRAYHHPWIVLLGGCEGVLISRKWVLTAAHCIDNPASMAVYYSFIDLAGRLNEGRMDAIPFVHPDYVPGGGFARPKHDVALLLLEQTAPAVLQPADLPRGPVSVGQAGFIANTSHTSTLPAGQLALYDGKIAPGGDCFAIAGDSQCIHSDTASLCQGDSGSGFISMIGGRATVVGIASFAQAGACNIPGRWAMVADVYGNRDWILQKLRSTIPHDSILPEWSTTDFVSGNYSIVWSGNESPAILRATCSTSARLNEGAAYAPGAGASTFCPPEERAVLTCSIPEAHRFSFKITSFTVAGVAIPVTNPGEMTYQVRDSSSNPGLTVVRCGITGQHIVIGGLHKAP